MLVLEMLALFLEVEPVWRKQVLEAGPLKVIPKPLLLLIAGSVPCFQVCDCADSLCRRLFGAGFSTSNHIRAVEGL